MSPIPTLTVQPRHIARQSSSLGLIRTILVTRSSTTYTTTLPISLPTTTTTIQAIARSTDSNSPNTGVVIAAVLSSILGTLVLLTVLYKCCINNRSAAYIPPAYTSYSSSSFSSDGNGGGVRRRGGDLRGHHRHRVCRPERARTRVRLGSAMRSEMSYHSTPRSRYGERHGSTSRAVRGSKDGMLGWLWLPRSGNGYVDRRYAWPRERRYRYFVDD